MDVACELESCLRRAGAVTRGLWSRPIGCELRAPKAAAVRYVAGGKQVLFCAAAAAATRERDLQVRTPERGRRGEGLCHVLTRGDAERRGAAACSSSSPTMCAGFLDLASIGVEKHR